MKIFSTNQAKNNDFFNIFSHLEMDKSEIWFLDNFGPRWLFPLVGSSHVSKPLAPVLGVLSTLSEGSGIPMSSAHFQFTIEFVRLGTQIALGKEFVLEVLVTKGVKW